MSAPNRKSPAMGPQRQPAQRQPVNTQTHGRPAVNTQPHVRRPEQKAAQPKGLAATTRARVAPVAPPAPKVLQRREAGPQARDQRNVAPPPPSRTCAAVQRAASKAGARGVPAHAGATTRVIQRAQESSTPTPSASASSSSSSSSSKSSKATPWQYVNLGSGDQPFSKNMFGREPRLTISNVDPQYKGSDPSSGKFGGTAETLGDLGFTDASLDTVFSISPFMYNPIGEKVVAALKVGGMIFVAGNENNPFFKKGLYKALPPKLVMVAFESPTVKEGDPIPAILKTRLRSYTGHPGSSIKKPMELKYFVLYEKTA